MSVRHICMALALVLAVASCADGFDRTQAIAELRATGASDAEATCIADTLGALGQLEAADSRSSRTTESHEALIAASTRCLYVSVLPRTVERSVGETLDDDDPEGTPMNAARGSGTALQGSPGQDPVILRQLAIDHLRLAGRSVEDASCVVDHLIDRGAGDVLSDPGFGMGLDALEADAFAACL